MTDDMKPEETTPEVDPMAAPAVDPTPTTTPDAEPMAPVEPVTPPPAAE